MEKWISFTSATVLLAQQKRVPGSLFLFSQCLCSSVQYLRWFSSSSSLNTHGYSRRCSLFPDPRAAQLAFSDTSPPVLPQALLPFLSRVLSFCRFTAIFCFLPLLIKGGFELNPKVLSSVSFAWSSLAAMAGGLEGRSSATRGVEQVSSNK